MLVHDRLCDVSNTYLQHYAYHMYTFNQFLVHCFTPKLIFIFIKYNNHYNSQQNIPTSFKIM